MSKRFSTFDLFLMAHMATLIVVGKIVLRLPLKVPGKSGLFELALLLTACHLVPKRWSATLVSLFCAVAATFLGHGDGLLFALIRWGARGLMVDLCCDMFRRRGGWGECLLAAGAGALAKSISRFLLLALAGATSDGTWVVMGLDATFHLLFGLGGGLLGFLLLRTLKRAGLFVYLSERVAD